MDRTKGLTCYMYSKHMPLKIVGFVVSSVAHRHRSRYALVHCIEELERRNKTQTRRLCIVGKTTVALWIGEK